MRMEINIIITISYYIVTISKQIKNIKKSTRKGKQIKDQDHT